MVKLLLIVVAVSLAVTSFCDAKCKFKDQVKTVSVDFEELAEKRYSLVYVSGDLESIDIDHAYIDWTKIGQDMYDSVITIIRKGGKTEHKHFRTKYMDGVLLQLYTDVNGMNRQILVNGYILTKTTENAMLLYLCSDNYLVDDEQDGRYILAPVGTTLSDESVKKLKAVDNKYKFNTKLFELPYHI